MSYKLGLLLSIVFLMGVMFLAGDLINVSIIKNSLDSLALTVSYRISYDGMLTQDTRALIRSYQVKIRFEEGNHTSFRIGDTVVYYLSRDYDPFILNKETMSLSVKASAVVGYYRV